MTALRCRPGDLAIVTGKCVTPGLRGRFVIVERLTYGGEIIEDAQSDFDRPTWLCRAAVNGAKLPRHTGSGAVAEFDQRIIADALLTPIRDNEGDDEMLRLAGRPRARTGSRIVVYCDGKRVGELQPMRINDDGVPW